MPVHLDQADTKFKHSRMTCNDCVQLLLDVDGIDARIDIQILKTPQILLLHLSA